MLVQTRARVILPQSFHSLRGAGFDGADAAPVEAREQSLKLGVTQRHQPVPDRGPGETVLLQPLVG